MPQLSRWFVKSGMVCLLAALVLALTRAAEPVVGLSPALQLLRPTDVHLLVVGWLTQLIFGVSYWMFPKPPSGDHRGSERLGWACFLFLNAGLLLRLVGEPLAAWGHPPPGVLLLSAALQAAAGWAYVLNTWPRARGR